MAHLAEVSTEPWPTARSRAVFIALAGTLPRPLHSYAERGLSRIPDVDLARLLHPLLVTGSRPSGEELLEAAWNVVRPLLDLTPAEKEYCDRLQRGELEPELLFPAHPEIAGRVAASPPLLWKAQNARRFAGH